MRHGPRRLPKPDRLARSLAAVAAALLAGGAGAQLRGTSPLQQHEGVTTSESAAASRNAPAKDSDDVDFLLYALRSSLAEEDMGALAQQQSRNPAIQAYGKKLYDDHARTASEVKAALGPANVAVPSEPSVEAKSHRDALAKLSGPEFDAAFLPMMVAAHKEAIDKFGAQTHANPDRHIAELAAKTLPILEEHLATAEKLQTDHSGH